LNAASAGEMIKLAPIATSAITPVILLTEPMMSPLTMLVS